MALRAAWRRFPGGVYLLWYPVERRASIDRLELDLKNRGLRDVLRVQLSVDQPEGDGMRASGMILVNPPWTLEPRLRVVLQFLVANQAREG
jgi:23S rRNA (adenine2030-N6)-methyltransferase